MGGALAAILLLLVGLWWAGVLHVGRPNEKVAVLPPVAEPTAKVLPSSVAATMEKRKTDEEGERHHPKGPAQPDPVADFKLRATTFQSLVPKRPFAWEGGDGKWRKFRYQVQDIRLDVRRSDSLVAPFTAVLSYTELRELSSPYPTKAQAEAATEFVERSNTVHEHVHTFTFSGDAWKRTAQRSRYQDGTFNKTWGEWDDCKSAQRAMVGGGWMEEHLWAIEDEALARPLSPAGKEEPAKDGPDLTADIEECRRLANANKSNRPYIESAAGQKVAQWRRAAEAGSPEGQYLLGRCCELGTGIEIDQRQALTWYRKAAEQGFALAQAALADALERGNGVRKDAVEAVRWYRKAADQGLAVAQNNLGVCYSEGSGVEKDEAAAVKWYTRAAEQGYVVAQRNLGACYYNGDGIAQDYNRAAMWFRKAAEQGDPTAQFGIGQCYYKGRGVPQDLAEAAKWYRKASDQGNWQGTGALALLYKNGQGVPKDPAEAERLLNLAAEQLQKEKK